MLALLAFLAVTAPSQSVTSDRVQQNADRARRAMGYIWCLYGTKEDDGIVGLPSDTKDREAFLSSRMQECAAARKISEAAYFEAAAMLSDMPDALHQQTVARDMAAIEAAFRENVLHPRERDIAVEKFEQCLRERGSVTLCP